MHSILCRSCHFYITYIKKEREMSDAWVRRTEVYLRMMNNGLSKTKLDDSSALALK